MIINTPDTDASTTNVDSSDAASINTLVSHEKTVPTHLIIAIFLSVITSTLAFSFTIVNAADDGFFFTTKGRFAAAILAFIFTIPHHAATILLKWLQHHEMAAILPFSPFSARAIGYSIALLILWIASTVVAATNIANAFSFFSTDWSMPATMATSAIELVLVSYITLVCFLQYRQHKGPIQILYPLTASPQPKVTQV